jgi:hypothetical protein
MMNRTHFATHDRSALLSVIFNLASPHRIALHMLSVVGRVVLTPLIQLVLGIMVKRVLGLNTACLAASSTQLTILRRYINSVLLSQKALDKAFRILGSHYEVVSVSFHVSFLWNIRHDQRLRTVVDCVSSHGSQGWPKSLLAWHGNLLS